jgi:hypothetical protein
MKTKFMLTLLAFASAAGMARAVIPVPVWEHLINHPNPPVPPMTNYVNDVTDSDFGDGHSVLDTIGPLKRYDATRLLLGIRENGVNETAPNLTAAQLWVSTNYPDRSLIWINPTNGQPMGIALRMGLYPVALDNDFITEAINAGTTDYTNQYYWSFDVSSDGHIYSGYKDKILRYDPDGSGGISPTPHVVFTLHSTNTVHGNLYTTAGSFPIIRVRGAGVNTVILAGGMSSTRGAYRLATTNGTDFFQTSWLPSGWGNCGSGAFSAVIPSPDPNASPGEEWVFGGWFPGSSSGSDSKFARMATTAPYLDPDNNFANSGGFNVGSDPGSDSPKYTGLFTGAVGASSNLNYVVAYSTPSWNSGSVNGGTFSPGWLAVLDITTGNFISSYKLNVRESDALLTSDGTAKWEGTYGWVDLHDLGNGQVECIWSSGLYGYGRYLMVPYLKITDFQYSSSLVQITFLGDGNGQLQRTTSLNPANWQDVGVPSVSGGMLYDFNPPVGQCFYRVKLVP